MGMTVYRRPPHRAPGHELVGAPDAWEEEQVVEDQQQFFCSPEAYRPSL